MHPTFSPDGRHVGFLGGSQLFRLGLNDGISTPVARLDSKIVTGLAWDRDGRMYWSMIFDCIGLVEADGGTPRQLTVASGCSTNGLSRVPGTEWFLQEEWGRLELISSLTGEIRLLGRPPGNGVPTASAVIGASPFFVAPNYVVLLRDSTLFAAPFDRAALTLTAEPRPILVGVRQEAVTGTAQLALAEDGTLVWAAGADARIGALVRVDTTGRILDSLALSPGLFGGFLLAPDGRRLAVHLYRSTGQSPVAIADLERRVMDEVPGTDGLALVAWVRQGQGLIVGDPPTARSPRAYLIRFSSGRPVLDTMPLPYNAESADGRWQGRTRPTVIIWPVSSPQDTIQLDVQPGVDGSLSFSPNGRWATWLNPTRGSLLAPTIAGGADHAIRMGESSDESEARWSRDGRTLVTRTEDGVVLRQVPDTANGRPGPGRRFRLGTFLTAQESAWSLTPEGSFVFIKGGPYLRTTRLEVMTNFPEFVRAKLAEGRAP
jgi:hypothetical protein